ncbi:MAG: class I mannose-6-phosphate isomerase [Prevotellaceae bacterium]|jgi:mannose-6-phosphate isomerase|nr:class I mannose-6-phosphate isomerase [Prevotellaceae bacterium]
MDLYPLKFKPIYKERVWGGNRLSTVLGRKKKSGKVIGESWELSSVSGNLSVVANGYLRDNNIQELIETYMGDITGDRVYEKFGIEFPLLFKLIDSAERLSVQVHPDDEIALERHRAYGKTEMWYVMDAAENSQIYVGFNKDLDRDEFRTRVANGSLPEVMNIEQAKKGDVFFLPAGRIHAIGENLLIAEIQQTSDVTYRIYDWGRENNPETAREMHTQLAEDVIDYKRHESYKTRYAPDEDSATELVNCKYFTTNLLSFSKKTDRRYAELDSFVVYMCLEGSAKLVCDDDDGNGTVISTGETVLIPAIFNSVCIIPEKDIKLLEVYIS